MKLPKIKNTKYPYRYPHEEWLLYKLGRGYGDTAMVLLPIWGLQVFVSDTDPVDGFVDKPAQTFLVFYSWKKGCGCDAGERYVDWPATFGSPQSYPCVAFRRFKRPPILLTGDQDELASMLNNFTL